MMNNPELQVLRKIQTQLEATYEIDIEHDIRNFTFSDRTYADAIVNTETYAPEQLIINQQDDYLNISLYLDKTILKSLKCSNPYVSLHRSNLQPFWIAVEGVSHFLYVAWRAQYDRPASQLELELQAEIDKFVCATKLLMEQRKTINLNALWTTLFRNYYLREQLSTIQIQRYLLANQYAGKYCQIIQTHLKQPTESTLLHNRLRRFYRLNQTSKIDHIADIH